MKLLPSDPDIETIVARIRNDDLDLQPDFQRGEVWSDSKKRRLIDTILRDWHIPPIHVIERPDSHKQEVLDGQQRLVAIRDFVNGLIRVDGKIEPFDSDISAADQSTYETLPQKLRRRFDRFTIRVFRLVDFRPDEPGELFFRLNQPTSLTAAEQRNAFFGPVRAQIRALCERFPEFGLTDQFLGFSNSRMAYDDIVAKLCLSLERGTLWERITAGVITERYRNAEQIKPDVLKQAEDALVLFGSSSRVVGAQIKFNKATLFSWLCFAVRLSSNSEHRDVFPTFLLEFEKTRARVAKESAAPADSRLPFIPSLLEIFTDRASLRVSDVTSVVLRDAVLSFSFLAYLGTSPISVEKDRSSFAIVFKAWSYVIHEKQRLDEAVLLQRLHDSSWGTLP